MVLTHVPYRIRKGITPMPKESKFKRPYCDGILFKMNDEKSDPVIKKFLQRNVGSNVSIYLDIYTRDRYIFTLYIYIKICVIVFNITKIRIQWGEIITVTFMYQVLISRRTLQYISNSII